MRRRSFLQLSAGVLAGAGRRAHARDGGTFVLVHGAWHGAWCWQRLLPLLGARGYQAHGPTLAGVGERINELSAAIVLDTHIGDVVALLEARDLWNVILVGHSYAGAVITGVADRVPQRLKALVFLDAVIVGHGGCMRLPGPEPQRPVAIPPPPAASFGIPDPGDCAWVQRNLTPHPARSFESPLVLGNPIGNGLDCAYIACTRPVTMSHGPFQQIARSLGGRLFELATGHDAMVTAPGELAELLEHIAQGRQIAQGR